MWISDINIVMRSHESGEILTFGDGNFIKYEETGVKQVQNPAFLLVAGVLGERLGYNGINVPIDTNTRLFHLKSKPKLPELVNKINKIETHKNNFW